MRKKPVNCEPCHQVNRRVSPEGLAVLRILAGTTVRKAEPWNYLRARTDGGLRWRIVQGTLSARVERDRGRRARESVRTLRRLWNPGLVELCERPFY